MLKRTFIICASVLAIAALSLSSCKKDDKVKYLTASITIDESNLGGAPSPESYKVTFTNVSSAYTITVNSNGTSVSTDSLITGVYDVVAQAQFSEGGFAYNYIGTASDVEVNDAIELSIPVTATKASALVFKEVYYTGCKTTDNKNYFRDQFYEIYNNSDQTVYADGLCIGEALSCNTYTWNDSDVPSGKADDYIFFGTLIWQIPGNGTDYPIAPGESIVLAQYATNHADQGATSGVDLSTADFEFYIDDYSSNQTDCNAINMNLICNVKDNTSKQYMTSVFGTGVVLFYPSVAIKDSDFIASANYSTTFGREVLRSDVIDAYDAVKNETTNKKLPESIDAGSIYCSGKYVGESIVRKVASTNADGTYVYQDTNNTTEDFEVNTTPTVRRNDAKRPSWSTWTTAQ